MAKFAFLTAVLAAHICLGQGQTQHPTSGARELFYSATGPKDSLPAAPESTPAAGSPRAPAPAPSAARHLGLRYTLLLVGPQGDQGQVTDASRNFRKGDCLALNLEANRSGYLYVLARESAGDWQPLFPTPGAGGDNRVDPGQVIRTPRHGCFEIDDPPGTETLFVVLSRDPRDVRELAAGMQSPGAKTNAAVDQVDHQFGTRELVYSATDDAGGAPQPAPKKEPAHAVYVVSGSDKPSSTLVTKVEIRHR